MNEKMKQVMEEILKANDAANKLQSANIVNGKQLAANFAEAVTRTFLKINGVLLADQMKLNELCNIVELQGERLQKAEERIKELESRQGINHG